MLSEWVPYVDSVSVGMWAIAGSRDEDKKRLGISHIGQAHLSGTGGCLFVRFEARQAADAARAQLPAPWRGWVARGLNRHPLLPDPIADR